MVLKSELLRYWEEGKPAAGFKAEDENMIKNPVNSVEDLLFVFILSLLY